MPRRFGAVATLTIVMLAPCACPAVAGEVWSSPRVGTTEHLLPPQAAGQEPIGGAGLTGEGVLVDPGVPAPPELKAGAYLVADLDDGRVILAKNAHLPARPASTLKALTALTLSSRLNPRDVVEATPRTRRSTGARSGSSPAKCTPSRISCSGSCSPPATTPPTPSPAPTEAWR